MSQAQEWINWIEIRCKAMLSGKCIGMLLQHADAGKGAEN